MVGLWELSPAKWADLLISFNLGLLLSSTSLSLSPQALKLGLINLDWLDKTGKKIHKL